MQQVVCWTDCLGCRNQKQGAYQVPTSRPDGECAEVEHISDMVNCIKFNSTWRLDKAISFREDVVKDEDTCYIPTIGVACKPVRHKVRHSSPQMLPSYPSNSHPAMSSDLVQAYHVGRLGVQIISEPWWRQDSVSKCSFPLTTWCSCQSAKISLNLTPWKLQTFTTIKWELKCQHITVRNVGFPFAFKEQVYNSTVELMHL